MMLVTKRSVILLGAVKTKRRGGIGGVGGVSVGGVMRPGAPPKPSARGFFKNNEHKKSRQDKGYNNNVASPVK